MTKAEMLRKLEGELYALHDDSLRLEREIRIKEKQIKRVEDTKVNAYRPSVEAY